MDIKRHVHRSSNEDLAVLYPLDLQMYDKTPTSTVLLHEFEEMALQRLKALKALDTVAMRGYTKFSEEWRNNFKEELNKQDLKQLVRLYTSTGNTGLKNILELRRRDHISHFILCLAFCRTDELRHWFTNKEIELFQIRFDYLTSENLRQFLKINHMEFKPISEAEKKTNASLLMDQFQFKTQDQFDKMDFYKIPFRKVLELVRARRVLMKKGYCYIAASDLVNVLVSKLRQEIAHSLAVLRLNLPETSEDKRLDAVLKCLLEHHEAGSYRPSTSVGDTLRMEDLDEMSKRSFPPCMRRLHEALRTKHHLRHQGRQQYQLFLKAAGLPLEECLKFWRTEFMKVMAPEKFEKEHSYNIRHNYGKEGNCTDYSAYGCRKIIQSTPGPEDCHGCPFRHSKPQELRRLLLSYGISNNGLAEVMEYTENQMYTLACQKLFVVTHPDKGVEFGLCHPNQYYAESRQLITGVSNIKLEKSTPDSTPTPSSGVNSSVITPASSSKPATPMNKTPLSSKNSAPHTTPVSSKRALPINSNKQATLKDADTALDVSNWLDEVDGDTIQELERMDTQ